MNKKYIGIIFATVLVGIALVAHGYNMFEYPYYENDEGIYMAQAYAFATEGKLSPYAYWYDHAPAGWITLAGWAKATGGFFTFGSSVDSGRVLMLLLHGLSALLLFFIARRLSGNYFATSIAVLVFSLSPLAIYYQRRVLLDNMMIFWVLVALALLITMKVPRTWHIIVSAIAFGIAVLTKESAIFFFPAFLYVLYSYRGTLKRRMIMPIWGALFGVVVALYPLYALMRGEFFPKGFHGDTTDHVSLIETLTWQMSRGSGLSFWQDGSEFLFVWKDWLYHDPYLTIGGVIVTVFIMALSVRYHSARLVAFFLVFGWFFLLRGGIVLNFYIIPLIPFIGLAAGLSAQYILMKVHNKQTWLYQSATIIILSIIIIPSVMHTRKHFSEKETHAQMQSVNWVKKNISPQARIIIDDYAYVDYHAERFKGDAVFPYADVFSKVEDDVAVREVVYKNDWRNADYIVASSVFDERVESGQLGFVGSAYRHSQEIKKWRAKDNEYAHWSSVRKVDPNMSITVALKHDASISQELVKSWFAYKKFFIRTYGQIIDPSNGVTTSEGQSYAMLRAVWTDDKEGFDGVWSWTRDHLQFREKDKFFSWKWVGDKLEDPTNATDADEDIALALLFAYKKWGDTQYLTQAEEIIYDLWNHAVVRINDRYYFIPAHQESMEQWNGYLFNPSYVSPASYRIFAEVDTAHPWDALVTDSYRTLNDIGAREGNKTYLPSDWVLVEKETGKISTANAYFDYDVDRFSFDAFRTLWRVSLDHQWFQSPEASNYLNHVNIFLTKYYKEHKVLPASIKMDGQGVSQSKALAVSSGYLSALMVSLDQSLAEQFYIAEVQSLYDEKNHYWGKKYNYYDANWAWFGTALYNGDLTNYWK